MFNQIASMRYTSGGQVSLPLTIRGQQGAGKRYGSQHSRSVESVFAHFPGIKVVAAATPYDAKGPLISCIRDDNPCVFQSTRCSTSRVASFRPSMSPTRCPSGRPKLNARAKDLSIVSFSYCLLQALEAAEQLSKDHGIDCEVIDLRTIVPLDMPTVFASLQKTGRLLAVHESYANSGIGAEIVARFMRRLLSCCALRPGGWARRPYQFRSPSLSRTRCYLGNTRLRRPCWI